MNRIGIHGGHDATIALDLEGRYEAIELERYYGIRHFDLYRTGIAREEIAGLIEKLFGPLEFESASLIGLAFFKGVPPGEMKRWDFLKARSWERVEHHIAHAACSFYQSPFERALVISYDGGGNDGFFRFFTADREHGAQYLGEGINLNMGAAYGALAYPIKEIYKAPEKAPGEKIEGSANRNAGKLMGLGAYGAVRREWVEPMERFYLDSPADYTNARTNSIPLLGRRMGLDLESVRDCIEGETSADFAATATYVFEKIFLRYAMPVIEEQNLPVCMSGGCALNVLVNEKLASLIGGENLFVPPNSNDCGLALGALWQKHPPAGRPNITYAGLPLLDFHEYRDQGGLAMFLPTRFGEHEFDYNLLKGRHGEWPILARALADGKVIGVARGKSEHGPRALGNRSILADASVPGLKDRLNNAIKFREPFRPYAPVVRKEDAGKYFEIENQDMTYMSFSPRVRPEWRKILSAITHEDGTARVQTVTREQNSWLYDLLGEFEREKQTRGEANPHGVLLNTSFNTRGKPILTTAHEAFLNLLTTVH